MLLEHTIAKGRSGLSVCLSLCLSVTLVIQDTVEPLILATLNFGV